MNIYITCSVCNKTKPTSEIEDLYFNRRPTDSLDVDAICKECSNKGERI